jgi:hypothetical protein
MFLRGDLGALDPAFLMSTGAVTPWNGKDPRSALTNVTQTAYAASHPTIIQGVELDGPLTRLWAWFKGER